MKDIPSKTAIDTLASRAIASIAPKRRRILNDPHAAGLLPPAWMIPKFFFRQAGLNPFVYPVSALVADFISPGGILQIALRHRFMDDCLVQALRDGFRRVIILGAGYDSRAIRFGGNGIEFIEIDHPLTQRAKRERLTRILGGPVDGVRYLPIDFRGDWAVAIRKTISVSELPTFFIWEGVGYYLPVQAVRYTLDGIRTLSPGGGKLVFDMFPRGIADPSSSDPILRKVHNYGARRGEHFLWGCDREEMPDFLKGSGYRVDAMTTLKEFAVRLRKDEKLRIAEPPVLALLYNVEASF